jgi:hypothetical protein
VEHLGGDADLELPADLRTIVVRAAPDEQLLAYAALAELCAPLLGLVDHLPPVQARALDGALALGPAEGDALAVAAGFRSLLHLAAEREPLLVVVQDAHLLDRGTAAALAFAARRVDEVAVGIVIIQEPGHTGSLDLRGAPRVASPATPAPASGVTTRTDPVEALDRAVERGSVADVAAALEASAAQRSGPERIDLLLDAGQAWLDAGQVDRAMAAVAVIAEAAPTRGHVARTELLRGRIESMLGHGRQSTIHLQAAAEHAAGKDPEVAARALLLLVPPAMFAGRVDEAGAALRAAREHLEGAAVDAAHPIHQLLLAGESAVALATGQSTDTDVILRLAAEATARPGDAAEVSLLVTTVALPLIWLERFDVAAPLLRDLVATLRARGAIGALPMPLCGLSVAERRSGRITRALILAAEAQDLAEQSGNRGALLFAQAELANVHSVFGDADRCHAAADAVLRSAHRGVYRTSALSALATVELWSGDPATVIDLLEPLLTEADALSPSVTLFHHTLITAYVALGREEDALPLLAELVAATPLTDGRLRGAVARCQALLAPAHERDACFADAIERAGEHRLQRAWTQLIYARRLLADGCTTDAATLLHELSAEIDENLLGVARAARLTLTRLGIAVASGDPAWAQLGPAELEVALAAAERTPVLTLADRLRLSPPEVERLRDDVLTVVGARSGPAVAQGLRRPSHEATDLVPHWEILLLGGLRVLVDGRPVTLPEGAASITVALLAVRRAVHVEELTDVLWPEAPPAVARRRLRNVLGRVRQAAGSLLVRVGQRVELAPEVVVDHHLLETRARRALAMEPGPARLAALEALLDDGEGPLLPGLLYEEWTQAPRHRAMLRQEELEQAAQEERAPRS